ncbi:MAG: ABC transporter substrate-binding protein, partial [Desulfobacteraceae bacterium]|nr:ABC transporter substrate-binding protein [Desulfobacteraceae bacterium]
MSKKIHKGVHTLKQDLDKGKITRREFIRYASLLGVSVAAATSMTGLLFRPGLANAGSIQRGGTMKIASPVQKVTHLSNVSWISPTNQLRGVAEYLTYTDPDNVTHPYLLENWETSDDLKTWTLNLRKGIKFNNGDDFTADDVLFTFKQWFDKDVGSSMMGMM